MSTKNGWAVNFAGSYKQGGPPTEVADLVAQSLPNYALKLLEIRATKIIKELDRLMIFCLWHLLDRLVLTYLERFFRIWRK
jgi:hypothetical protein